MIVQDRAVRPRRAVLSGGSQKKHTMAKQPRKMTMERSLLDCIAYRGLMSQADLGCGDRGIIITRGRPRNDLA